MYHSSIKKGKNGRKESRKGEKKEGRRKGISLRSNSRENLVQGDKYKSDGRAKRVNGLPER